MPEFPASKGRLPSFYLLLVFFSLTAGIVTAAPFYENVAFSALVRRHFEQAARDALLVAYAIQDGRGSRTT